MGWATTCVRNTAETARVVFRHGWWGAPWATPSSHVYRTLSTQMPQSNSPTSTYLILWDRIPTKQKQVFGSITLDHPSRVSNRLTVPNRPNVK